MRLWATKIKAIDPRSGNLVTWIGDNVPAFTENMAREILDNTGRGYMEIIGEVAFEIPCKEGTFEPDFSRMIDYNAINNN